LGNFFLRGRIHTIVGEYLVKTMGTNNIFEASNLDYDYPGNIVALRNINFGIGPGEVVALVGANGSGKSTLLKLLDGLIFPTNGELTAFNKTLSEKALKDGAFVTEFRRKVGLVFQDPDVQLFSSTVWDEVTFGPLQLGISKDEVVSRGKGVLELLNIAHLRERPPYRLSGGEKKKVSLACVLSLHPQVLLLDEPTTGLDPRSQGNLIDFLLQWADKDKCLIFSTQDLDIVEEIATRIIVMGIEHNILADGKPEEFLSDADFLLRTNLVHEHSHRHKQLIHRHPHLHEHQHQHQMS
jgi:cobalt/nickel transport system ATP-binding protein